ncbi:4-hydroxy-3-methylbut-2-enyl diphosphate reductase [Limisphaera ngatamarikiensis]|uniref:4-hydroxy-3-methylbut-2-enyl diphosphate reductase n=1 Tax=Limisphaera ngatamarikiensis TaxID=1324935 RepID=A0A6M1S0C4_9BACT|nr:4-hydroxy-3-methylbut-2-enyl diphosphate reductase [Limisphaera ngatamarikiensis]NGO40432.1 4-hydroxy-3-methylbut-2-enyl diphosphate reductase [Limisphaera ngatamarikiensis]
MTSPATHVQGKINLRRPDIMEAVQAQVMSHYRSELVERIRARGHEISAGGLTVKLARQFGFCYGVERAIDLAYAARKVFPDRPLYILGEIIHNPEVNDQIRAMGIKFLTGSQKDADMEDLRPGDIVIIPAFGTDVATRRRLEEIGCQFVDTTCGDVMSVWKRVRQYSREGVTSIIHGKAWHEETKATSSQARAYGSGHYLVVYNLEETDYVCRYIVHGGNKEEFLRKFAGAYSEGFDPDVHLEVIGVANQTTMLRGETEEVQRRLRNAMIQKYGEANLHRHFRYFDTICGATQDRQDALEKLLEEPLDLLLVIGGYNSSNTSHLAEMGEARLPTYFIKNASKLVSNKLIRHFNLQRQEEIETRDWLPDGPVIVGVTAGASCPNNLIEDVIRRLFELRGISVQELLAT